MANMLGQDQAELSSRSPLPKQTDITPTTTCQFNNLPTELLQMIMRELQPSILSWSSLSWRDQRNLVVALAADKDKNGNKQLPYYVAQYLYSSFARVDDKNIKNFFKIKRAQLEKINNIVLVEPISFTGHTITAYNNIQTIIVDITNTDWKKESKSSGTETISWIIRASRGTTQKLIVYAKSGVITDCGFYRKPFQLVSLLEQMTKRLGPALKPKWKLMPDQGVQCWTWEDSDGLKLSYDKLFLF
jgi:hypothetical protein